MMGMTHVFAGTMAAVVLSEIRTPGDCLAALIGGALGAVACDMDLGRRNHQKDNAQARNVAVGITLICLAADRLLNAGLIRMVRTASADSLAAGLVGLILLYLWGRCQPHRGGTHSLLMVAMLGLCAYLICPPVSVPLMIGMGSHLALDLFNRRPLQLLYPLRGGICLKLCKADGRLDRMLRSAALLGTVFVLGMCVGGFV